MTDTFEIPIPLYRTFCVRINNVISTIFLILAVIIQCSVFSPMFFNLFLNDIPRSFHTNLELYVDDTTIYASDNQPQSLCSYTQTHIEPCMDWCSLCQVKNNEIKLLLFINPEKLPTLKESSWILLIYLCLMMKNTWRTSLIKN